MSATPKFWLLISACSVAVACNAVLGLDQKTEGAVSGGSGGAAGSSGKGTGGRGGGAGNAGKGSGGTQGGEGGEAGAAGGEGGASGQGAEGGIGPGGMSGTGGCTPGDEKACGEVDPTLLGNCALGRTTCATDATWRPCPVQPQDADSCDEPGDDATCDGTPNKDCPCVNGTTQPCGPTTDVGACEFGVSTCEDEMWGPCEGATIPAERDCASDEDLDCDGSADSTIDSECECEPGDMEPCNTHPEDGVGICRPGSRTCVGSGATSAWGLCTGAVGPGPRVCTSSSDNDCNGIADNIIDMVCKCSVGAVQPCGTHAGLDNVGICRAGTQTCLSGTNNTTSDWGGCTGSVGPSTELCNNDGLNEDCEGGTNEGCACLAGQTQNCGNCNAGTRTCNGGATPSGWGSCMGQPGAPVTYYRDYDGDGYGSTMNGTTVSCTGAPSGYVTSTNDCCDNDGRVKPGATWTDAGNGGCGRGGDFDCDGTETHLWTNGAAGYWANGDPGCGNTGSYCYAGCYPLQQSCK